MPLRTGYSKKIKWCLCPAANKYIEKKLPDVVMMNKLVNDKITVGTDSYASNHFLSMANELNVLLEFYPALKLEDFIKWSTINGARFLGIEEKFGSFEKGKNPGLVMLTESEKNKYVSIRID